MIKHVPTALAAALLLSACGGSGKSAEQGQGDTVEMPAEEAVGDVDATPVPDPAAAPGADATAAAEPAAAPAPSGK